MSNDLNNKFVPFTALVEDSFNDYGHGERVSDCARRVQIVGVAKPAGEITFFNRLQWIVKDGPTAARAYKDTPENIVGLTALEELRQRHSKEEREMEEQHRSEQKVAETAVDLLLPQ